MRKIICLFILCLLVYMIYYFNHTDKITYISIGDSLSVGIDSNGNTNYGYSNYIANYLKDKELLKTYNNDFSASGTRIKDLKSKLETNWTITKKGKTLSLKECLRDADLVTLSIGMDDLLTKITLSTDTMETMTNKEIKSIVEENIKELESLFKELRKYAKDDIILIGYYNPFSENIITERLYSYLINKTKEVARNYDIEYLDVYNLFKKHNDYIANPTNFYPSAKAYEAIATKIIENYL